jgi:hypothetical protein
MNNNNKFLLIFLFVFAFIIDINAQKNKTIQKKTSKSTVVQVEDEGILKSKYWNTQYLDIDHFSLNFDIYLNDLLIRRVNSRVLENLGSKLYTSLALTPFLYNDSSPNLKFKILPGEEKDGVVSSTISKKSYFEAVLVSNLKSASSEVIFSERDYVTDTNFENGSNTYYHYIGFPHYGQREVEYNHKFKSNATNDMDTFFNRLTNLKNIPDVKTKVLAAYSDLKNAILANDSNKIKQMLRLPFENKYLYEENSFDEDLYELNRIIENAKYATIFKFEENVDIFISKNGKLGVVYPKNKDLKTHDILRVIGKDFAYGFNFYFFISEKNNVEFFIPIY